MGARLIVDLDAVVANWRSLRAAASGARCAAVVKADAYGLGASAVARQLYGAGCRQFFVAQLEEGIQLRPLLPSPARVFVLNGLWPGSERLCADAGLVPVLNSLAQVVAWQQEAARRQQCLPAALQLDTGMHRLGLPPAEWQALVDHPQWLDGVALCLVMSHLASAERVQAVSNRRQWRNFMRMRAAWPDVPASLANSSGVFLGTDYHFDLVRPGAALYGIAPQVTMPQRMQPVLRLEAPIVQVRDVPKGGRVGYNGTWRAARASRIATVALGYADGYPRALGNRASASVAGYAVPVVGRVSMDTLTLDITDLPVTALAGAPQCQLIDAERNINVLAELAGISPYTLLTGLGRRPVRIHQTLQVAASAAAGEAACLA